MDTARFWEAADVIERHGKHSEFKFIRYFSNSKDGWEEKSSGGDTSLLTQHLWEKPEEFQAIVNRFHGIFCTCSFYVPLTLKLI